MSDADVTDRQAKLESLAHAVVRHGRDAFEVSLGSNEFTVERRHGQPSMCTVMLLPHEPTFQVHFDFGASPALAVTFHIGADNAGRTAPAATIQFGNVDEAAEWLLKFFATSRAAGGG